MSECCIDLNKYCQDAECICEKTDDGITIKLTGKTEEKIKQLHNLVDDDKCTCC